MRSVLFFNVSADVFAVSEQRDRWRGRSSAARPSSLGALPLLSSPLPRLLQAGLGLTLSAAVCLCVNSDDEH